MKKKAYIFPGQGAQKPFMGESFYNEFLESREIFQEAEHILSMNIRSKIFCSDEQYLTRTDFCQIALFVNSMAILKAVEKAIPDLIPVIAGGLSLGEYSALVSAKKCKFSDLLTVVRKRGELMQMCSKLCPQGMAAVIGLSEDKVPKKYEIANINSPNQIVISGAIEDINDAKIELKDLGAKAVIPLKVSGAFHSSYMDKAKQGLIPYVNGCDFTKSNISLVMNVVGQEVNDPDKIRRCIIEQVSQKTMWLKCVEKMESYDVEYIEFGSSQLTLMNKKTGVKNTSLSVEKVEDLENLYEKISR